MNVTQAAQFDGPMNGKIAETAEGCKVIGLSYAEYRKYCGAHNGVAVLSEAEYDNFKLKAEAEFEKHIAKALLTGTSVMSISWDENDQILIKHWDESILFNQRNHTE